MDGASPGPTRGCGRGGGGGERVPKALRVQTPPEKVFWGVKPLLRRYLDCYEKSGDAGGSPGKGCLKPHFSLESDYLEIGPIGLSCGYLFFPGVRCVLGGSLNEFGKSWGS